MTLDPGGESPIELDRLSHFERAPGDRLTASLPSTPLAASSFTRHAARTGEDPARSDGEDFQRSWLSAGLQETHGSGAHATYWGRSRKKAVRELPRDAEVIALYKKLADGGPLPPR